MHGKEALNGAKTLYHSPWIYAMRLIQRDDTSEYQVHVIKLYFSNRVLEFHYRCFAAICYRDYSVERDGRWTAESAHTGGSFSSTIFKYRFTGQCVMRSVD